MLKLTCLITTAFLFLGCGSNDSKATEVVEYFCDAESKGEDGRMFKGQNSDFKNFRTQSDEEAFSGEYSSKVDKEFPYSVSLSLNDVQPGEFFEVSAWRKSAINKGVLVVGGADGFLFKVREEHPIQKGKDGWEKIHFSFVAPIGIEDQKINVFGYNPNEVPAYFDDMKIVRVKNRRGDAYVKLKISEDKLDSLVLLRNTATKREVITSAEKVKFPTELKIGGEKFDAKFRLKGDWTDHITGGKWSVRITVDKGEGWNGAKTFSVSSPHTRSFLNEWVFHQMLEKEGVLTTDYDFYGTEINNQFMGVYAFEEYFGTHLLKSRGRKKGPILRLQENSVFETTMVGKREGSWPEKPWYHAAEVQTFNAEKNLKKDGFREALEKGQALLFGFKNGEVSVGEAFDLDLLAKYAAIIDVSGAYHAKQWHNIRFYVNPETQKMEPIGYDGFGDHIFVPDEKFIGGFLTSDQIKEQEFGKKFFNQIYSDTAFVQQYLSYVKAFSSEAYLKEFFGSIEEDLKARLELLITDYPYLKYDAGFIHDNAKKIREELPAYEELVNDKGSIVKENLFVDSTQYSCNGVNAIILPSIAIKPYWKKETNELLLFNFHCSELKVTGKVKVGKGKKEPFEIIVPSTNGPQWGAPTALKLPKRPKKVKVFHRGEEYKFSVYNWVPPVGVK